jgi:hypothetical protein
MDNFFEEAAMQNNPIRKLKEFIEQENRYKTAKQYDSLRFVGYIFKIGFKYAEIITCDPNKIAVGGIPRNSFLIMIPRDFDKKIRPHFTLLRVLDTSATPLESEIQQTYFELHKRSMPELDVFTSSELQWGALKTEVLGMFYPHPYKNECVEFSGDVNNYVSAHKYEVYAPNDDLLNLIVNSMVPKKNQFAIGELRMTECRLLLHDASRLRVPALISTEDFLGTRTAMFGKTRLGKSNVVKLIAQSIIETTKNSKNVGQLIFDINGEYANDNLQDDCHSLASGYPDQCIIYALTQKENTLSKRLKINFYEHPSSAHKIIGTLLQDAGRSAIYIERFISVDIPSIEMLSGLNEADKKRAIRKILMYWAILKKAGFPEDEQRLKNILWFDPHFNKDAMKKIYGEKEDEWPKINTLESLVDIMEKAIEHDRQSKLPSSTKGKTLFDADDEALLNFLKPTSSVSAGPGILQGLRPYHDKHAANFVTEIISELESGKTIILDLGNANEVVMQYFSRELSKAVFARQTEKFSNNQLGKDNFIQLYFEEAHNLFGNSGDNEDTKIYRRFAKEGAKYHIGMVYSTQSPSTITPDLLAQTENFFVAHLSSADEASRMGKLNIAYENLKEDILQTKTQGYMRMLTRSHRFVIPIQANKFTPPAHATPPPPPEGVTPVQPGGNE